MRGARLVFLACLAALIAAGCNDTERVDLVFRAAPGSHANYSIVVDAEVVTQLAGPAETTRERIEFTADQLVLTRSADEAALHITMTKGDERPRVFEVRLDPRGGLAEVDRVEGLPVEALGELGPSRLILLASGLLPGRPLQVGGAWDIERDLELPEGSGRLTGEGRLENLRIEEGVDLARIRAVTSLPVERELELPRGKVRLAGTEHTTATLDYGVADGTVHRAHSVTKGRFTLVVLPPGGETLPPVEGELRVRVESRTSRTDE